MDEHLTNCLGFAMLMVNFVNHALNCPQSGLVYGRHNKTRDLNCDLLEKAGLKQVKCEPVPLAMGTLVE